MLINSSQFTAGPRQIFNATLGTQTSAVNAAILGWVGMLQQPFLIELLGENVGNLLHDYDQSRGTEEFEVDEELEELGERVKEPFADYTFFRIIGENNNQATMTGLVKLKGANEYVSPMNRQVSIWNDMVGKIKRFKVWADSDACPFAITIDKNLLTPINRFNL